MRIVLGVLSGFLAGVLSGAFGVGGAVLTTPAVQVLLGAPPLVAVGTPLPVILPTTLTAAVAYHRRGHIDYRTVAAAAPPGVLGAVAGAALTRFVNPHALLLVTALLMARQAFRVARPRVLPGDRRMSVSIGALALVGLVSGIVSGLLGVGGGVVLMPVLSGMLGMPLKTAVGTSLVIIAIMVIPGTVLHAVLGHIDWGIFSMLAVGVIPGAAIGSRWAMRSRERSLRITIASFLFLLAAGYAVLEVNELLETL